MDHQFSSVVISTTVVANHQLAILELARKVLQSEVRVVVQVVDYISTSVRTLVYYSPSVELFLMAKNDLIPYPLNVGGVWFTTHVVHIPRVLANLWTSNSSCNKINDRHLGAKKKSDLSIQTSSIRSADTWIHRPLFSSSSSSTLVP
jgi:hypothetical protein